MRPKARRGWRGCSVCTPVMRGAKEEEETEGRGDIVKRGGRVG